MLIDEQDGYVFAVTGIAVEGGFDGGGFRFGIDDEEVLLCVRRLCYVLDIFQSEHSRNTVPVRETRRTPMPARSRPVTESFGSSATGPVLRRP